VSALKQTPTDDRSHRHKRYQLRYGKTPPELAALVPEFVTSAPYDCMSGNALGYRLIGGTFVLYSVGEMHTMMAVIPIGVGRKI